jgi:tryptophanyl-tRNA synthetase
MTKRIFSGIQPTGSLHIGNYLGALKQWIPLQDQGESLFCIVDSHAITMPYNPTELKESVYKTAAAYLASGLNPDKTTIFVQSSVLHHAHLAWILGCLTPMGWLSRMTQFKDKSSKMQKDQIGYGLFSYPVLMAADILLYKTTHVPVGEDQKQHVEMARDVAGAFNRQYNNDYFPIPLPLIPGTAARIMSLRDGSKKMSKSDLSEYSRIHLDDSAETIALKIQKAKTDSDLLPDSKEGLTGRFEAENLLSIYSTFKEQSLEASCLEFGGQSFSTLKKALTEVLVETVVPIGNTMKQWLNEKNELKAILQKGPEKALKLAETNMKEIHQIIGFWE